MQENSERARKKILDEIESLEKSKEKIDNKISKH
jgi:hypothetical protein